MINRNPLYFRILNSTLMVLLSLLCILPIVHVFMMSVSAKAAVEANLVGLWPIGFHWSNYQQMLGDERLLDAFQVSFLRVVVGVSIQLFFILTLGYCLAREANEFKGRNVFMWFIVFPMLFQGGLIPTFLLIRQLGLLNTFWALVIGPIAIPIFSIILMMNFFRSLPHALYESAMIDGAGHWSILLQIFVPLAKPAIATMTLFSIVAHWNAWFDGLIYMNDMSKWPVQTFLRSFLLQQIDFSSLSLDDLEAIDRLSNRSLRAAQLFIATVPVLAVYPFLQKHFIKGIVLGSVKE